MLLQRLALRAAVVCALLSASPPAHAWEGVASTYGHEIFRINPKGLTANGERFQPHGMTAAHWTLPFNTRVRVTDLATGRSVVVRINDRGPHPRLHRTIDLATGAAQALGMTHRGLARVRLAILRAPGTGRLRLAAR
ncbi:septal ring lytic transglycosylase RlpA family protein [Methylobacterium sp. E-066]|uniref:septal ring lytic transglycosylase RlpA family protein n=1 Tax=Methylobacterium sp. E-066 TaxID=2836584 RepID=UPI001FBABD45|nr:septal ring lytic transglycosylase RlpA family protein [Methylobacterium sp. E-066]MCJ2139667.1 septal ring lytic transglycosylase RlpA family protein [Methylobacterium sp. E-066]